MSSRTENSEFSDAKRRIFIPFAVHTFLRPMTVRKNDHVSGAQLSYRWFFDENSIFLSKMVTNESCRILPIASDNFLHLPGRARITSW